ncbi:MULTISPECIES: hypothetical protein [unclassified Acidovorax]|uniref:hypothetical protein n=1 Tax=unclassified Acidovorax TaxID=2684926 RepID=UPI002882E3FD|nr:MULTISPECIES: hypothetical protein [unclassified Acidovorax]
MKSPISVRALAFCVVALSAALHAGAQSTSASVAEPQPGMWAFEGEVDGQPGRSLHIETQLGQAMIVSYLGYRANGSALFLQASGVRQADDSSFAGTLQEFRNGPVLGGSGSIVRPGEVSGSVGDIRLAFDSPTSGTVTLPGDTPRRISRFSFSFWQWTQPLGNRFVVHSYPSPGNLNTPTTYQILVDAGVFQMNQLSTSDGRLCSYSGLYQERGGMLESEGTATCTSEGGLQQQQPYRVERFAVDRYGMFTGTVVRNGAKSFLMGPCLAGGVFTGSPDTCASGGRPQLGVEPGMWAFDDELNGTPGRSLQIDTQVGDGPMVVSYLGYRSDGSSLFLQGSAFNYSGSAAQQFDMPLQEFRNGPVVGGVVQGGEVETTIGNMRLEFDSPTTGTVTLPFDTPRRISRYRYEDHTARFDKTYSAQVYALWRANGAPVNIDLVARDNVFRMDTRTADLRTLCEYRGTYRLAGDGLTSDGTRTCTGPAGTTSDAYRAEQFTVDRDGRLRGVMSEVIRDSSGPSGYQGVNLYLGSCSLYRLCSRAELEQPR